MRRNISTNTIAIVLFLLMLISTFAALTPSITQAQPDSMTFTTGERIEFTSTTEMQFKTNNTIQFSSGVKMKFQTNVTMHFIELDGNGLLMQCDWIRVFYPAGYIPPECSWWEVIDPTSGRELGEIHIDGFEPPDMVHIDMVWPTSVVIPPGGVVMWAKKKIDIIEPCSFFEVHWPSDWWPQPCTWWEIMDPETGEPTGYEFHVDWTNESCEFHVDDVIPGPYVLPFPWYEVWARQKIPGIQPCDYLVVEEPHGWWPQPCTWWEILDPFTGEPTHYEFHVDWTNESCEFHVDKVIPEPFMYPWPGVPYGLAEEKVVNITRCMWFQVIDPVDLPGECTWWEILDPDGAPTGKEFHVDATDGRTLFHIDGTTPDIIITIPPQYIVTTRQKIDIIQQCDWFKVDDPTTTPVTCTWWEVLDPITGEPTGWEFHVDEFNPTTGWFHVDDVIPGLSDLPPTHALVAEKKIDDIQPCDWFKVIDPSGWVPQPCSWWQITWPRAWNHITFHVDRNDGDTMFHVDAVVGGIEPIVPPPYNVTAVPYEPPPLPWYMKASYPDYAPSGMPDFDQRQNGTYVWRDPTGGRWSHCGPTAVGNSLFWLDSEFEPNMIPPPAIIDNYPLVQSYNAGGWDDHAPQNVPPLIEHLAYLMDTDGLRTGLAHLGTNVFDMQAGITHYLSWSGVNPLGDVDGDGNVTNADLNIISAAWGSSPGMANWDIRADIAPVTQTYPPAADNVINNLDLLLAANHINETGQFYEHTLMAPMWRDIEVEVLKCQDVVLLIAPWTYDPPSWYRYDEVAHFVTVAGLNGSHLGTEQDPWEIVISDPMLDNAEAGGYGDVPIPHVHPGPEPPYVTHNDASLVSHDAYHVVLDAEPCPGGPLTIMDYPRDPQPYPIWKWQIEAAVITSPYVVTVHDVAVTNVTSAKTVICQGCLGNITATVENQGDSAETFNVTAYANTTVIGETTVSLPSLSSTDIVFTWNATGFSKGNYTISAVADIVAGETDTADNTYIDGWVIVSMLGDITGPDGWPDGKVDMRDVGLVARHFGKTVPPAPPNCDVVYDGKIDMRDVGTVARHFGETDP